MAIAIQRTERNTAEQYSTTYERANDGPTSEAVVAAVAAVEGVDPADLDARLHDSIDPDALDGLSEPSADRDGFVRVTFEFAGYDVDVETDGRIVVRGGDRPDLP